MENNVDPAIADGVARREFFRLAKENRLIQDIEEWMVYHAARNRASYEYDRAIQDHVLNVIGDFVGSAHAVLIELRNRQ